jgi:hypothetical protein
MTGPVTVRLDDIARQEILALRKRLASLHAQFSLVGGLGVLPADYEARMGEVYRGALSLPVSDDLPRQMAHACAAVEGLALLFGLPNDHDGTAEPDPFLFG